MENENEFLAVHHFKRGEFRLHKSGIIEGIVEKGVEIDQTLAEEYAEVITSLAMNPTGLLINKLNSYSLSFKAQTILSEIPNIIATALLVYSHSAKIASLSQKPIMSNPKHSIGVFESYEEALNWLHGEVKKYNETTL